MPRSAPRPTTPAIRAALAAALLLGACAAAPAPGSRGLHQPGLAPPPVHEVELRALDAATLAAMADPGAAGGPYRLGIGDVVQLHVVDEPELTLTNGYPVEPDGAIEVPYLGRVPAADRSAEALRADLTERLRAYHPNPQVFVRIIGFNARQVTVIGAVRQPGRQTLTDRPLSVIDAINAAGGFLDPARRPGVTLLRGGRAIAVDIAGFLDRGQPLPLLADGDIVQVAAGSGFGPTAPAAPAPVVTLHARGARQDWPAAPGLTLAALAAAAGPGPGDMVYLLRPGGARIRAVVAEPAQAMDPALGGRLMLAAGDAVVLLSGRPAATASEHLARLEPFLVALVGG
jgi:polysaccharide export outer membrane protein